MIVVKPSGKLDGPLRGAVVAIGNFDGLHRGHQELLAVARKIAAAEGRPWGLLTFEPHPRTFFRPTEAVFRLTPDPLKQRLAQALGADFLATADFDERLSTLSPEQFIAEQLVERLGVSHVVTGFDFHFGRGRKGTSETLGQAGLTRGFGVTVVDQVSDDDVNAPFSSSSIRSSLRRGHVHEAAVDLGYQWMVMGEVVQGDQRGRTIGFPTANIIVDEGAEPYRGIYAVTAQDAAGGPLWQGAAYFGDRPTFNTNRTFLETYLLDQDIDLYGRILMVNFVGLVRGDKTFSSVGELIAQMKDDCEKVRGLLGQHKVLDFPLARLQAEGKV